MSDGLELLYPGAVRIGHRSGDFARVRIIVDASCIANLVAGRDSDKL